MALTAAEIIKADQEHLIHPLHHPIDHAEPMIYVRGKGATIETLGGERYIDGLAGLWNVNVGHGRAELAEAAAAQMKELAYFSAYTGSSNLPAVQLAEKLIGLAYDNMQAVFFTCGGAESNESAFKTARFYWKTKGKPDKIKVISRHNAYHGVTQQAGQTAARLLDEAITREGQDTVAAFIAEPIHGGGGVLVPDDDYFRLVREVCTKREVLFIGDEVITGFCRTGRWFALSHWNVKPDIMSFAKGVTSGYLPLGGIMVSRDIKDAMDNVKPEDRWMHAYTYSGHPTCCAVGLKNIEIMERERLWENAAKMGTRLYTGLQQVFKDHPNAGDIRGGKGLLAAVELVEDRPSKRSFTADKKIGPRIQQEMTKRGVITRVRPVAGAHPATGDTIFYAPPLVISEAEVDRLVSVTRDAVKAVLSV